MLIKISIKRENFGIKSKTFYAILLKTTKVIKRYEKCKKWHYQKWGSVIDSEDALTVHGSVDKFWLKNTCVNRFKTAVNHVNSTASHVYKLKETSTLPCTYRNSFRKFRAISKQITFVFFNVERRKRENYKTANWNHCSNFFFYI